MKLSLYEEVKNKENITHRRKSKKTKCLKNLTAHHRRTVLPFTGDWNLDPQITQVFPDHSLERGETL
jgi:hypothetical protein